MKNEWIDELSEEYHDTKEKMIAFLMECSWPYDENLHLIEWLEKQPYSSSVWRRFPKTWWQVLYSISVAVTLKGTGKIEFIYPNGTAAIALSYVKGSLIIK